MITRKKINFVTLLTMCINKILSAFGYSRFTIPQLHHEGFFCKFD
jgi:hypothetical protein